MYSYFDNKDHANVFPAVGISLILETLVCETIKTMIAKTRTTWRRSLNVLLYILGRMELDFWDDMIYTTLSDLYTMARLLWL